MLGQRSNVGAEFKLLENNQGGLQAKKKWADEKVICMFC